MNAKLGGFLGIVLMGALVYANIAGRHAQRDTDRSHLADSVAKVAEWKANAVKVAALFSMDSAAKVTDSVRRSVDAKLNIATRNTNAVRQKADSAVQDARRALADSGSTNAVLRANLEATVQSLDSLNAAIGRERLAGTAALRARDSSFAHERLAAAAGFKATIDAKDAAARAVGLAFSADLKRAEGHGLRVGRLEGLTAGALLLGGLVYLVKS